MATKLTFEMADLVDEWMERLGETQAQFIRGAVAIRLAELERGEASGVDMVRVQAVLQAAREKMLEAADTLALLSFAAENERREGLGEPSVRSTQIAC